MVDFYTFHPTAELLGKGWLSRMRHYSPGYKHPLMDSQSPCFRVSLNITRSVYAYNECKAIAMTPDSFCSLAQEFNPLCVIKKY